MSLGYAAAIQLLCLVSPQLHQTAAGLEEAEKNQKKLIFLLAKNPVSQLNLQ